MTPPPGVRTLTATFAGVPPSSDPADKSFSEDPQDLRKWRRGVAAAIEAAVASPRVCL